MWYSENVYFSGFYSVGALGLTCWLIYRPSSDHLTKAAIDGSKILHADVKDFGEVTTPMLHYFVAAYNSNNEYGDPSIEGYFNKLTSAFRSFREEVIHILFI